MERKKNDDRSNKYPFVSHVIYVLKERKRANDCSRGIPRRTVFPAEIKRCSSTTKRKTERSVRRGYNDRLIDTRENMEQENSINNQESAQVPVVGKNSGGDRLTATVADTTATTTTTTTVAAVEGTVCPINDVTGEEKDEKETLERAPKKAIDTFTEGENEKNSVKMTSKAPAQISSPEKEEKSDSNQEAKREEEDATTTIQRPMKRARTAFFIFADDKRPQLQKEVCTLVLLLWYFVCFPNSESIIYKLVPF